MADPKGVQNIFTVNGHTAVAYHENEALGKRFVEQVILPQADTQADVVAIATQSAESLQRLVEQETIKDAVGLLFFGHATDGRASILGWFHVGDQTRQTRFFPFCTTRPCALVGYLIQKLYSPDFSLIKALELSAYAMTQLIIETANTGILQYEHFSLAFIHPEDGFHWLERQATESIVRKGEERDQLLRARCTELFLNGPQAGARV